MVVPTGNTSPELCVLETDTATQLSVAVGAVHVATWSHVVLPAPVVTETSAGQLDTTGAVLSITVMVVLQVLLAPFESVTVKVTFVVPTA